jgi:membrane protease YdiL (CAAX protease family)
MTLEKLQRGDFRLIAACIVIAAISLFVGVRYYFLAFPEASIEFRVTRESSAPVAESFLKRMGLETAAYRHAAVFGFDDEQKTFLERELGVAESNRLLETTVRLWRWQHRWFRPLQKEEMAVDVTTKGEIVGLRHLLPEDAAGAGLAPEDARKIAERYLVESMARPLDTLSFVEASSEKRPHRTDHTFTWKVTGSEVHGADYRVQVGVAGDAVSSYGEYLKVPDTWQRDYAKLRSKNEIAGEIDSVLLLLTVLAMLVVLVLRIRRGDVRWKAASFLGGLIFVLLTLSQLNSLPSAFHGYDTTTSFGGFVLTGILRALASGFGAGVLIFVLAASAEPLYRERFPGKLSLTSLLRLRALRTREFFIATLVGLTLTCFFFAYENVFYLIANALGAWSPRDVAYSDLLSTAFPWIYVLFFGFLPAISEEFISRMFSIPFFERIFRNTAAAIVVAAFIWGFGHAGYPNQPFWIRGLEVGIAGMIFGLVLLRWGILAVVVCHFSVDALYTAFVLIRSPDLYYRISGSLSAGVFLLLLLAAAVAYFRAGGFVPGMATNESEGVAPAPPPAPPEAASPFPSAGYRPLPIRRIVWGLGLSAVLVLVGFAPLRRFGETVRFRTTRAGAREAAARSLHDAGFDVGSYRSAIEILDRTDPAAAMYLLKSGGLVVANDVYGAKVPTPLWRVRFFVPGQKEEYNVSVDPDSGKVVGFSRELLDDAAGTSLDKDRALEVARTFLDAHGVDPAAGELKEQSEKDEKARRDHTLVWEFPETGASEARVRHEVVVQGDVVGSWGRSVKIPEDWRRQREKSTALTVALSWAKLPLIGGVGLAALLLLIGKIRSGGIPWKFAFVVGGISAVAAVVRTGLNLDALWNRYDTSVPVAGYLVVIAIGLFVAAVMFFVVGAVVAGLAGALHPAAVSMMRPASRKVFGRDALVAGVVAFGLALGIPGLARLFASALPAGRLLDGVSFPGDLESAVPFLTALAGAVMKAIFVAGLGGIVAAVAARYLRSGLARGFAALAFVVAFLPGAARAPAEFALEALVLVALVAGVWVLATFFLRDNPLAWLWSGWLGLGGATALRLMLEPASPFRWSGALLALVILASTVWLWASAGARVGVES